MTSVLSQFRFNKDHPFIARAALRGIGSSLNFSILALAAQHLRSLKFGEAITDVDEHFGHTIDQRNEIDVEVEGDEVAELIKEGFGIAHQFKPIELAARLKIIRDSCAAELEEHAGIRKNPITNKLFKNQFDLVSPISESLAWQLNQPMRISEATVKDTVKVLRIDEQSVRLMLEKDHERQQKFTKDNAAELYSIIDNLEAVGLDGHAFGIADDESVEERLPALNRARLFVAADNGLVSQRIREVKAYSRGNVNAFGNIGLIDGERKLLRLKWEALNREQWFKGEVQDAVSRGAKEPVLQDLFPDIG